MADPVRHRPRRSARSGAIAAGVALLAVPFVATHSIRASLPPRLLPVPIVSQAHPWSCGAAALMSALLYFGVFDDPESRLDAELAVTRERGTSVENIVAEAHRFGLEAQARTGLTVEELDREMGRGAVVIVALQAWADHPVADWKANWEDGHYVVIVGVSDDRVYVMDPSIRTGYGYLPRADFVDRWHDYDLAGDRKTVYQRLGIVIRGAASVQRFPAEPAPVN